MKPRNQLQTFVALLVAILALPAYPKAGGGREGHGGDTLVANFTGTYENVLHAFASVPDLSGCLYAERTAPYERMSLDFLRRIYQGDPEVTPEIRATLQNTPFAQLTLSEKAQLGPVKFSSKANIILDGNSEDAENIWSDQNEPTIFLARIALLELKDPFLYDGLVLHEFFGLFGIEATNEFDKSRACVQSLVNQGFPADRLMYRESPISSIERQFFAGDGKIRLHCENSGDQYDAFSRLRPGKETDLFVAHQGRRGRVASAGVGRFFNGTPADLLARLRLDYDIDSGIGTVVWETNLDNGAAFRIKSTDHIHWEMDLGRDNPLHFSNCTMTDGLSAN